MTLWTKLTILALAAPRLKLAVVAVLALPTYFGVLSIGWIACLLAVPATLWAMATLHVATGIPLERPEA